MHCATGLHMGLRPLQLPVRAGGVQELLGLQRRASGGEEGEGGGGAAVADGPPGEWATVGKKQRNFTQRGDEELSVRLPSHPPRHAAPASTAPALAAHQRGPPRACNTAQDRVPPWAARTLGFNYLF